MMLRIINLGVWGIVLFAMLPALWRIARGRARTDDPMRLAFLGVALVIGGFQSRWLLIREDEASLNALLALSAITGGFTLVVAWAAKKGRSWRS